MNPIKARIIAFYLPQYHPIPENDKWWGKGFTEWISVVKAKPLFRGHYQPKIPGELGFYDLRLSETREQQAKLAKEHGIQGFCYWHYWFGNGKQLLERPFNEVLECGKPDFPFCLGWANHSWKGVFFGAKGNTLISQEYLGENDAKAHFMYLLKAFKDPRYIRVDNKPLLHIYNPKLIPNCKEYIKYWRMLANQNGLDGLHVIGGFLESEEADLFGVDGVTYANHREIENRNIKNKYLRFLFRKLTKIPGRCKVYEYKDAMKYFIRNEICHLNESPVIIPNWDTTARLGKNAVVLHNSTPELFKKHVKQVLKSVAHKEFEKNIIFLRSWNEWAEGNYIEPDEKFEKKYLEILKDEIITSEK